MLIIKKLHKVKVITSTKLNWLIESQILWSFYVARVTTDACYFRSKVKSQGQGYKAL